MIEQPHSPISGPGALERARLITGMTTRELWFRYLGMGGTLAPSDLDDWLRGYVTPDPREYLILATALNEELNELGLNHPLEHLA